MIKNKQEENSAQETDCPATTLRAKTGVISII